jgi:hypothetical protein
MQDWPMTFYYCDGCDRALTQMHAIEKIQRSYGPQLLALWDQGKPPLPAGAIGYGYAAFLIGTSGFRQKTATFAAARQPWLDLLLDANAAALA